MDTFVIITKLRQHYYVDEMVLFRSYSTRVTSVFILVVNCVMFVDSVILLVQSQMLINVVRSSELTRPCLLDDEVLLIVS